MLWFQRIWSSLSQSTTSTVLFGLLDFPSIFNRAACNSCRQAEMDSAICCALVIVKRCTNTDSTWQQKIRKQLIVTKANEKQQMQQKHQKKKRRISKQAIKQPKTQTNSKNSCRYNFGNNFLLVVISCPDHCLMICDLYATSASIEYLKMSAPLHQSICLIGRVPSIM